MADSIGAQLDQTLAREDRLIASAQRAARRKGAQSLTTRIEELIPPGLSDTLEIAFRKGFALVLKQGNGLIQKTYNKEKVQSEYALHNLRATKAPTTLHLRAVGRHAKRTVGLRAGAVTVEGGLLGLLGIGLPDIPLFIGVLLGGLYEIALSYGFDCQTPAERRYLLRLIATALLPGESLRDGNRKVDVLAREMVVGTAPQTPQEDEIAAAARALSDHLLYAKFVQGLPLVGVVGGAFNYSCSRKVMTYAALKYQKRYLLAQLGR